MSRTREGFIWTARESWSGLKTAAAVDQSRPVGTDYDVVVIGAGFAGLTAARDISQQTRLQVLLLDGRDRIGGRAWTANELGREFEMGASWVSLNHQHVYTELDRYGLQSSLELSAVAMSQRTLFKPAHGDVHEIDDTVALFARLEVICNDFFCIDGHTSNSLMPWPHDMYREPAPWKRYDHLSVADRIEQLRRSGKYDEEALQAFESMANGNSLSTSDKQGFVDLLTLYAYGGHSLNGMVGAMGSYKLGNGGMSAFALALLADFKGDIALRSVVSEICQDDHQVEVTLDDGRVFRARKLVCTVPLNVLSDINFSPPLSPLKQEAIQKGHNGRGFKIHFKVSPQEGAFTAFCSPRAATPIVAAVTDSESAEDNATYGIAFGYSGAVRDLEDHDEIVSSIQDNVFPSSGVGERSIDAYVAHDWVADHFARGTWVSHGPGFRSKYLEELRAPHGCIHFASADWADGWGGFVDGAIEQGARVARRVIEAANADVAPEGAASDR